MHVLVTPAGEVDQQNLVLAQRRRQLRGIGQRVAGFQRRDDALQAAQLVEGIERLRIGDRLILGAADVLQPGVLRADARVIEAGRN